MRKTCERPGCADPASVAFGMIPEDLVVWLEAVDPATLGEVRPALLCVRHADTMVVPLGWTLDDRREPVPRLFKVPERPVAPRRPGDHTARLRRPRPEDWATLALFEEVDPSPEEPADPVPPSTEPLPAADDPAAEQVGPDDAPVSAGVPEPSAAPEPWQPRFDRSDDLDGLLAARSPLLRRAFGVGRPDDGHQG